MQATGEKMLAQLFYDIRCSSESVMHCCHTCYSYVSMSSFLLPPCPLGTEGFQTNKLLPVRLRTKSILTMLPLSLICSSKPGPLTPTSSNKPAVFSRSTQIVNAMSHIYQCYASAAAVALL